MINVDIPSVKSFGEYDKAKGTVPVVFELIDNQNLKFDFERDINPVLMSDGSLDTLLTTQRAMQILSGLIHNCSIGVLSKAKQDEQLAAQAKSAVIAEDIAKKNKESEEAKQKMLDSAAKNANSNVPPKAGAAKVTETK